ncbi:uncharacterized protein [Lolium perenne]|uniref:uncharacterized protein n=1 Tax=Lolium perenne TaxID=4522 RepID=UPI0021F64639|nr:uncharacterized protein LOC127334096 [Lolium perenne]
MTPVGADLALRALTTATIAIAPIAGAVVVEVGTPLIAPIAAVVLAATATTAAVGTRLVRRLPSRATTTLGRRGKGGLVPRALLMARAGHDIGRGWPFLRLGLLHLHGLEGENTRVKLSVRYGASGQVEGTGEGVERRAKAGDDVVHKLVVADGEASGHHDVGEVLHLLHVHLRRHVALAEGLQLAPNMADVGTSLGAKHGVDGRPDRGSRLASNQLGRDLFFHGGEQKAEHLLILQPPRSVRRVGDSTGGITGALGDGLRRRGKDTLIQVAMEIGPGEIGQRQPAPQHEVGAVQTNGAGGRHGRRGDGAGGRRDDGADWVGDLQRQ